MSYAIHPYAVSISAVKKLLGSRDATILKAVTNASRRHFAGIDELDDAAVPVERALSHLILGEKLDERSGFKYGYALKFLCDHAGKLLSNETWSSLGWDWIETVDAALQAAQVDKKLFRLDPHLTTRGAPIPLPRIVEFPSIGYLHEAEIAKIIPALSRIKPADFEDEEVAESLSELRQWLDHCVRTHLDLVCFYH